MVHNLASNLLKFKINQLNKNARFLSALMNNYSSLDNNRFVQFITMEFFIFFLSIL